MSKRNWPDDFFDNCFTAEDIRGQSEKLDQLYDKALQFKSIDISLQDVLEKFNRPKTCKMAIDEVLAEKYEWAKPIIQKLNEMNNGFLTCRVYWDWPGNKEEMTYVATASEYLTLKLSAKLRDMKLKELGTLKTWENYEGKYADDKIVAIVDGKEHQILLPTLPEDLEHRLDVPLCFLVHTKLYRSEKPYKTNKSLSTSDNLPRFVNTWHTNLIAPEHVWTIEDYKQQPPNHKFKFSKNEKFSIKKELLQYVSYWQNDSRIHEAIRKAEDLVSGVERFAG